MQLQDKNNREEEPRRIMSKYAWYTRVTDTLHRLTVLTLVGGTLYMSGGLAYTLYMNGKKYEQQVTQQKALEEDNQQLQSPTASPVE